MFAMVDVEVGQVRLRVKGSPMTKDDDYRKNAAETVQLAQRAVSTSDKVRLLRLAEAWLDLADRTRRVKPNLRGQKYLHPLIREKLDRYVDEN